jgi:translation initiation factor 1
MFKGECLMSRLSKKRITDSGDISVGGGESLSVSIGNLTGREKSPRAETPPSDRDIPPKSPPGDSPAPSRVILRRETAGRGGRTVTVVETRPEMNGAAAEELAKAIRRALGCGSRVEGTKIILQGDIKDRAEAWFAKRGVKKIVMGNL